MVRQIVSQNLFRKIITMISDTEDNSFNKNNIKKVSNNPGIYKITNTINNKCYIGKSMHLRKRLL